MEDDELLNIGLWEDGAEKQLCCLVSIQRQTQIFDNFCSISYVQKQFWILTGLLSFVSAMKYCSVMFFFPNFFGSHKPHPEHDFYIKQICIECIELLFENIQFTCQLFLAFGQKKKQCFIDA